MTQTMKDKNKDAQRRGRPGQRQQERLTRIARRRRRRQILLGSSITLVVLVIASLTFLEYRQVTTQQEVAAQKVKDQQATTTTKVNDQRATATEKVAAPTQTAAAKIAAPTQTAAANASATAVVQATVTVASSQVQAATGAPMPKIGPASPPAVTGKTNTLTGNLKYIDIKVGTGAAVQTTSTVTVEYTGWITKTGKKFDSSYDHGGAPFSVQLGQGKIIPGWDQGLVGMKAGGTRRLLIPSALGYGTQGSPPVIPANADLIFDVTVLSVQ
jgi:FKBP-type peptidyl-prolyl cis-trans isomerase